MAHCSEFLADSEVIYGRWRNRTAAAIFAIGILAWSALFAEALRILDMRPTGGGGIVEVLYVDTGLGASVDPDFTIDGRSALVSHFAPYKPNGGAMRTVPIPIAGPEFGLEIELNRRGGLEWRPAFRRITHGDLCRIVILRNIDDVRATDCLSPVD